MGPGQACTLGLPGCWLYVASWPNPYLSQPQTTASCCEAHTSITAPISCIQRDTSEQHRPHIADTACRNPSRSFLGACMICSTLPAKCHVAGFGIYFPYRIGCLHARATKSRLRKMYIILSLTITHTARAADLVGLLLHCFPAAGFLGGLVGLVGLLRPLQTLHLAGLQLAQILRSE